ncbi:MAG: hypothetical protein K2I62_06075, partial [Alistipes sp.]|nr:hypothetical protein [Alistipes sp.]
SAAGLRHNSPGALTNVGPNGYYWSSSSYYAGNRNAGNLYFNSSNVNPLNNNNRANAFSVRCVQHLPTAPCDRSSLRQETALYDPEWPEPRFRPERSVDSAIRWHRIPASAAEPMSVVDPSLTRSPNPRTIRSLFLSFIPAIAAHASATGYRTTSTGALNAVGTNGYSWSSSSYAAGNINAGNLNFNSGNVNPLNGNNRANGFPVRCVQHLRRAVFTLKRSGNERLTGPEWRSATASVSAADRFSNPLTECLLPPMRESSASYTTQSVPGLFPGAFIPAIALHNSSAAGYRHYSSGALTNVGTNGRYWSSSSYSAGSNNAGNLNFHSSNVNPLNNNNRALGYSVRCVQHLPAVRTPDRTQRKNSLANDPEWQGLRLRPVRSGRFSNPLTVPMPSAPAETDR